MEKTNKINLIAITLLLILSFFSGYLTKSLKPNIEIITEYRIEKVVDYIKIIEIRKENIEREYNQLDVIATAYCSCELCCGIWSEQHPSRIGTNFIQKTATGTIPASKKTIAVDPDFIPLGSEVEIDGNIYVAEDIGGGIKGNRIDIFFDTHEEALNWGKQEKTVKIYGEYK